MVTSTVNRRARDRHCLRSARRFTTSSPFRPSAPPAPSPASSPTPSLPSPLAPCSRSVRLGRRRTARSRRGVCRRKRKRERDVTRTRSWSAPAGSRYVRWRGRKRKGERNTARSIPRRGRASSWRATRASFRRTARSRRDVSKRERERGTSLAPDPRVGPPAADTPACEGEREREREHHRSFQLLEGTCEQPVCHPCKLPAHCPQSSERPEKREKENHRMYQNLEGACEKPELPREREKERQNHRSRQIPIPERTPPTLRRLQLSWIPPIPGTVRFAGYHGWGLPTRAWELRLVVPDLTDRYSQMRGASDWTIPPDRLCPGRPPSIPLSTAAASVLPPPPPGFCPSVNPPCVCCEYAARGSSGSATACRSTGSRSWMLGPVWGDVAPCWIQQPSWSFRDS